MNMKKIMAGVVASVVAVGAMAVTASAAEGYLDISTNWNNDPIVPANGIEWDGGNFNSWTGAGILVPEGVDLNGDNAADYTITLTAVVDMETFETQWNENNYGEEAFYTDGIILKLGGSTPYAEGKGAIMVQTNDDGSVVDTYTLTLTADKINNNTDGTWYSAIQLGHVQGLKSLTIAYSAPDAAPAEDEGGDAAPAEDEGTAAPAEDEGTAGTGNTSAPTTDKQNANTGVEGVAVVAGLAIIAAGAVVVAKKRG